jgi:putative membrane protein
MMWYWGPGYGWGMMLGGILMMLLFWAGIFALAVVLIRSLPSSRTETPDTALETLRRRLAAGEITSEEFERLRKVLQG